MCSRTSSAGDHTVHCFPHADIILCKSFTEDSVQHILISIHHQNNPVSFAAPPFDGIDNVSPEQILGVGLQLVRLDVSLNMLIVCTNPF